jgi:hypothetical protein
MPMSSTTLSSTPVADKRPLEVVVVSHSPLFYWWPVWLIGFLMAGITYWDGYQVAFVPAGTVAEGAAHVQGHEGSRGVLIAPADKPLPTESSSKELLQPRLLMSASNDLGIIWAVTLCLVVVITHLPLRGLWSVIVIVILIFTTILLSVLRMWDPILRSVRVIDIHLTAFSYLSISLFLFAIWLITFSFFDRLVYMIFSRGQLRVRMAIGDGETVHDTRGMTVERHRDDLFRHWLLGFGSGDLTVRTSGNNSQQMELPNVLSIGRKPSLIQTMLQEREVIRGTR